jgi:hypothetical protein
MGKEQGKSDVGGGNAYWLQHDSGSAAVAVAMSELKSRATAAATSALNSKARDLEAPIASTEISR